MCHSSLSGQSNEPGKEVLQAFFSNPEIVRSLTLQLEQRKIAEQQKAKAAQEEAERQRLAELVATSKGCKIS